MVQMDEDPQISHERIDLRRCAKSSTTFHSIQVSEEGAGEGADHLVGRPLGHEQENDSVCEFSSLHRLRTTLA